MSTKYLGDHFDIHGGGMDLIFPHHESEVCQSTVANGIESVKYWMHNNMITINGQKMGKSLNNFITLNQFFTGDHPMLEQAYQPMTIRFFILQAHYRGTLDFSNEALQAADKGYKRLMTAVATARELSPTEGAENIGIQKIMDECYDAMNDDFNTPITIAGLFEAVRITNSIKDGNLKINKEELTLLNQLFQAFVFDIFGLSKVNWEVTINLLTD